METKTFFDSWLNAQNEMINNWTSTTHKMQEAITGGQAMEKGSEIYREWLENQMKIVSSASNTAKETAENGANTAQETVSGYFNQLMENQKKMVENFSDYSKKFFTPFAFGNTETAMPFNNMQKNWTESYNNWMTNWYKPFTSMMDGMQNTATKDTYQNLLNTSNVYFKMFEVWNPILKSFSGNSFSPENLQNMYRPEKFKEIMDNMMETLYPAPVKDVFEQMSGWFEMMNNYNKHIVHYYFNQAKTAGKVLPFSFGNTDAAYNTYANIFEVFQKSVFPTLKVVAPGKETEATELYVNTLDKFAVFSTKMAELQYLVYVTGQKAFEKAITEAYEQYSTSENKADFQAFFQNWLNNSEKTFIDFFKTDEYSKLQAELVDIGIEIKSGAEKLCEMTLSPYPVVLRSEADDLHKTIYELKKKVRTLEKMLELDEQEVSAEEAPKAKKKK